MDTAKIIIVIIIIIIIIISLIFKTSVHEALVPEFSCHFLAVEISESRRFVYCPRNDSTVPEA